MGRTRRVAALATAGTTGAALLAFAIGSGSAATQVDPASRSIEYLQGQQSGSDGSIPVGPSTDSVSEEYAIGAAAAGYDPNVLRHGSGPSVMAYLAAHAGAACTSAGACGELLQAVAAAGLNPASFGGVDLLTTLSGFYTAGTGVFGDGEAFTETLAIQGLVAVHQPVPAAALHRLVAAQDSDGGWDYLLIKDDPNGPTNFDTSDTNSTAMVLMALDAAGVHTRDRAALTWLHTQQDADGGFPYQAGAGTDPDSTALALQALLATGQNPDAPAWAPGGHSPLARLIASQNSDGGFTFPGNTAPDPFTTAQVPLALERAADPLICGSARCFQPGSTLNGASPTPTPAPTPTARPRPAPTPQRGSGKIGSPSPAPTGAVLGIGGTPTPAPTAVATATPAAPSPSAGAPPLATAPTGSSGLPTAAVYLLTALVAAVVVAGIAIGARRRHGA
ncbi:MAG: prenyltransferase/squalene oxidase repeat-containing protein [Candidatus Dormibacteria bacterium]